MKVGKYVDLGYYNDVKIGYGTVDSKNLKSIYLKLNSWIEPNDEYENYNSIISISRRKIKNLIRQFKSEEIKNETIVDLDIKTNGVKSNKKSFMNLEITLFVNNNIDIRDKKIKDNLYNMMVSIIDDGLNDKCLYNFYKTKN